MATVYLIAAGIGCTLIVVQFILQLIGLGGHGGVDHDMGAVHVDGPGDFHAELGHDVGGIHVDAPGDVHVDVGHDAGGLGEAGHDAQAAEHADGGSFFLALLSFRTISAFLAFFGLVGIAARQAEYGASATLCLSVLAGLVSMVIVAIIFRFLAGLQASGTVHIQNAVGRSASVYIAIPGHREGRGKITVSIQGRLMEFAAVTAGPPLRSGATVRVTGIVDAETLEVEAA